MLRISILPLFDNFYIRCWNYSDCVLFFVLNLINRVCNLYLSPIMFVSSTHNHDGDRRGCDRMAVGFTTTGAMSA